MAGILSGEPQSVKHYTRLVAACVISQTSETPQIFLLPDERPVLGIVISKDRLPPVQWWHDGDGSFVVLDGELHNARDLRTDMGLGGAMDNAAEIVLDRYRQGGIAALARIDASAGIVIWDAGRRELLILRDPEGAVPVFHAALNGTVVFSSRMTTLLEVGVPRSLDFRALNFFLTKGYAPAPWTFVESVGKLAPSHLLLCPVGGTPREIRYARRLTRPKHAFTLPERNDRIRYLMTQSLRRRHDPAASMAVLVSGGVDSALVLGCLVKLLGAKPDAFTFKYADYDGPYNEDEPASRVARHLGVPHHAVLCRPADLADNLPRIVRDYGEPFAWGLHSFMLGSLARSGVRTLLTGIGPDTWNVFKLDLAGIRFRNLSEPVRALARAGWLVARPLLPRFSNSVDAILRTERNRLPPRIVFPSVMSADLRREIYADPRWLEAGEKASLALLLSILDELADEDPYDQARLVDYRLFDAEALMFWNTAWARSDDLTVRHPYYDRDLQDFFFRLKGDVPGKRYLREFAATILPADVAGAPKLPHAIPIGHWFRGPLRDLLLDHLSPKRLRDSGLFSPSAVNRLVDAHLRGVADHSWRLWCLLATVVWQDTVLNVPASLPPADHAAVPSAFAAKSGEALLPP